MLLTIHQPNFLPWPGFFHKWMISDAMLLLDPVQHEKNEWQNRNRIKTAQGAQRVPVPVSYRLPQTIPEAGPADRRRPHGARAAEAGRGGGAVNAVPARAAHQADGCGHRPRAALRETTGPTCPPGR